MSDLHNAVQAEIAAHTPTRPPSFDALQARKHRRDRRRTIAAVAATALAAAGIAFGPSALGGGGIAPAQVAGDPPAVTVLGFNVTATNKQLVTSPGNDGQQAIQRCMSLPGLQNVVSLGSDPQQFSGRVVGQDNVDALRACVESVPGWSVEFAPIPDMVKKVIYTVRPSVKTIGNPRADEQRDACFALPGVEAVGQGESQPVIYRVTVDLGQSLKFEQCIGKIVGAIMRD